MGSIDTTNGTAGEALSWTEFYNIVDGKLETTQKTRHSINPANGTPNPEVPLSTREDVDRAMAAAQKAFKTWSRVPYKERQTAIIAFADAVAVEKESFSAMLTQEQGKPVSLHQVLSSREEDC